MRKALAKASGAWANSTFRAYIAALIEIESWKVALAVVLMFLRSISQGAQLLLLVPLMQLVGLDVRKGSVGWISGFVESAFAVVGLSPTVPTVLGAFVLFTTMLATITHWQTTFNYRLQQDFVAVLRRRLYRAVINTNWLDFSRARSSDLVHGLITEIYRAGSATAFLLDLVAKSILVFVYVLLALRLSATLTLMLFAAGAILLVLLRRKRKAAHRSGEDISLSGKGLYAAAIEHLSGMKTVKSYGAEERNAGIFSGLVDEVARAKIGGNQNYAETKFWSTIGSALILSAILFFALETLLIPAAGLVLLLFLFNRMIPILSNIQRSYLQFLNALPAFAEVAEMQARCEAAAEPGAKNPKEVELHEGIGFQGVAFSYPDREAPALHELDLLIEAGKTTAIVGPSGAGKSTVADLVMGLVPPAQGTVLLDGAPLDADRMRSWRDQIGYVTQETFLFNDTVRANLLWARPEATDEDIDRALKLAAAEGFVTDLPDGVDTVLGDRGVRLSGGERQRLALARALLREPSLLILDEATSALDSENEKRIQEAIEGLHGSTTILVITHRLSTVRRADAIHVLEHGRLVESGTWEALTGKRDGRFDALARAQGIGRSPGESAE